MRTTGKWLACGLAAMQSCSYILDTTLIVIFYLLRERTEHMLVYGNHPQQHTDTVSYTHKITPGKCLDSRQEEALKKGRDTQ